MPNAFDDLPQVAPEVQALASAAPGGGNAFDDLAPPAPKPKEPEKNPSYVEQAMRGVGLSANALAHGLVGAIDVVPDAATAAYNWASNPHVPSWEEINPFSSKAWPDNTPSAYADRALDSALPTPQTPAEKIASAGLSMEGGAAVPMPSASALTGSQVPSNFVNPAQQQAQRLAAALQKSHDAGYMVPPSTTNPTLVNKTLETIGGKEATQNQARVVNQEARNAGAAQDIGLKPEVFTPDAVAAVKNEAAKAFESARSIPRFQTDPQYSKDLQTILSDQRGANTDFPGAANPDVENIIKIYNQPSFTGDSAVSAVKLLRDKADTAYRAGNGELGAAYKRISAAIERQTERGASSLEQPPDPRQFSLDMGLAEQSDVSARRVVNEVAPPQKSNLPLEYNSTKGKWQESGARPTTQQTIQESGPAQQTGLPFSLRAPESFEAPPQRASPGQYSGLIDALRSARKTYAQASTIEDAMDPQGNVSGPKLAAAWRRGEPLSGNLELAAEHAANYPKANLPANSSNVSHLNLYGSPVISLMTEHATGSPWGLAAGAALPATRAASRSYLLSRFGQAGAKPGQASRYADALDQMGPGAVAGFANSP